VILHALFCSGHYNMSVSESKRSGRPSGRNRSRTVTFRFRLPYLPKIKRFKLPPKFGTDLRGLGPIHICSCGSQVFNVAASFDNYELVWYFLDATCFNCGNLVTVPCPVDAPFN